MCTEERRVHVTTNRALGWKAGESQALWSKWNYRSPANLLAIIREAPSVGSIVSLDVTGDTPRNSGCGISTRCHYSRTVFCVSNVHYSTTSKTVLGHTESPLCHTGAYQYSLETDRAPCVIREHTNIAWRLREPPVSYGSTPIQLGDRPSPLCHTGAHQYSLVTDRAPCVTREHTNTTPRQGPLCHTGAHQHNSETEPLVTGSTPIQLRDSTSCVTREHTNTTPRHSLQSHGSTPIQLRDREGPLCHTGAHQYSLETERAPCVTREHTNTTLRQREPSV
jgi:hypothetical protein